MSRLAGEHLWAMIDQGIVSFGSALTTILLARNLPPDQFGVAVLLIAGMLFLNTVHASLVVYPLSVHGARLHHGRFRQYVTSSMISTLLLAAPLSLLLGGIAAVLVPGPAAALAMLGLVSWQLQETARRALFADLRHRAAIPGDLLSYIGQAGIIGALGITGNLTLPRVFAVIAATSSIGAMVQVLQLRPLGHDPRTAVRRSIGELRSGRWTLPSNVLGAVIMQAPIWILGLLGTRAEIGRFQALIAIVGITNPMMFGVANVLMPAVARYRGDGSRSSLTGLLATSVNYGAIVLIPIMVALWLWPVTILELIYGQTSPYTDLATPLRVLAFGYLIVFLVHVGNAALFGLERPRDVLHVQVIGSILLIGVGFPAISAWGVLGAVLAVTVAHAGRAVVCARALGQSLRTSGFQTIVAAEGQ